MKRNFYKNRIFQILVVVILLLLFLKIDFRFQETVYCCGDDHDYYMHAETLAIDFDLDYSNQMEGIETKRFYNNGKFAPTGFIGSGIYASPFLFFGNFIDKLFTGDENLSSEIMNFRLLFYSLSPVFYFLLTINLTIRVLDILNFKYKPLLIYLIFFGSGVSYYAFERYSMTHVYESFSVILIFYLSLKYFTTSNNKVFGFLIPVTIALGISVKWVNYFIFLIPYFAKKFLGKNKINNDNLSKDYLFIFSSVISALLFLMHTKILYGIYTFNPQFVYRTGGAVSNFVNRDKNFIDFIGTNLLNVIKILFSQEFGLFWFSPIIFIGFILCIVNLLTTQKQNFLFNVLVFGSFTQVFLVVLLWRSTASSYGFRYLFCLTPLSIILYFYFQSKKNSKYINKYLFIFSIFSILSLLFFETTSGTQLALVETTNTFGRTLKYTQPLYLQGFLLSFLEIDSYLKIFTTSFFGAIIFKIIFIFINPSSLINLLDGFGLPVNNPDFIQYISEIEKINLSKFLFLLILFLIISNRLVSKITKR